MLVRKINSILNTFQAQEIYSGHGFFVRDSDWSLGGVLLSTHSADKIPPPCNEINTIYVRVAPLKSWIEEVMENMTTSFISLECQFKTKTFLG